MRHLHTAGTFTAEMMTDEPVSALQRETARCLQAAVDASLAVRPIPDKMKQMLANDTFVFSGCKTYHSLREMSQLLLDDNGKVRPFSKFRKEALQLHPKYNELYLEAEYQFALTSSESAAQWSEWQASGDRYDLQYRTAGDSLVRAEHAALDGTTLPVSSDFWASYMPPNGWRCRCVVKRVLAGKYQHSDERLAHHRGDIATTSIDADGRNRTEMFRFNPGAQQVVFPPHHPYYNNVPETIKKTTV